MASMFSLQNPVIKRSGPNAVVYDLSDPSTVAITLPVGSRWTSGLHWHDDHTEYLKLIKGIIEVTLDDHTFTVSADDESTEVKVSRGVWHEWKRADINSGEEVVVLERTDPHDGQKAVFFWNLNGVINTAQHATAPPYMPERLHGWLLEIWVTLSLFAIFRKLDNIPVYVNFPNMIEKSFRKYPMILWTRQSLQALDRIVSYALLYASSWIAWLVGVEAIDERYTPRNALLRWKQCTTRIVKSHKRLR